MHLATENKGEYADVQDLAHNTVTVCMHSKSLTVMFVCAIRFTDA